MLIGDIYKKFRIGMRDCRMVSFKQIEDSGDKYRLLNVRDRNKLEIHLENGLLVKPRGINGKKKKKKKDMVLS